MPATSQAITLIISFAYSSNGKQQAWPGPAPTVAEPGSGSLRPGPAACLPFTLSAPLDLGGNPRLGRDLGCPGEFSPAYTSLSLSPHHAAFVLWAVLGGSCGLASQAAGLLEVSSATCCRHLPRRRPSRLAAFPCSRVLSLQTNGSCHSATSTSLLVCDLSCPDNPFHLVLSLWMP